MVAPNTIEIPGASSAGAESLEQARVIGDTFTGGDVYWDDARKAVFGKASGEANQDYLQVYSDKTNHLQVFDSTKDGSGTIRAMSWQMGGTAKMGLSPAGRLSLPADGIDYSGNILPTVGVEGTTQIGSADLRVGWLSAALGYFIYEAAGAANQTTVLGSRALYFGAGGASALDARLRRSAAKTFTFDDNAAGDCTVVVQGKLTVTGAIDPTSLSLSGGTALYFDSADGLTAPLSGAGHARIRYNDTIKAWQQSIDGGAYGLIGGGPGSDTTAWHNTGDAFGADKVFGTTDARPLVVVTGSGGPNERFRVTPTGELFYGASTTIGSLESFFTNKWRFTGSYTGASGGNLLFLVDNQSAGAAAYTSIAAVNDQGVGAGLLAYSSGFTPAGGHLPGDAGLVYYTIKDIDPAAGAALFFDSGISPQKWITNNGDNLPVSRLYLTQAGRLILASNQSTLSDGSNMFEVRRDVNATTQLNVVNASAGAVAISSFKLTNDTNSVLLALASTGYTGAGVFSVDKFSIYNSAGSIAIAADGAKKIEFYTNPTATSGATRGVMLSNGALILGTGVTAQAGSELFRVSGGDILVDAGGNLTTTGLLKVGFAGAMTDGAHYAEVRHNANTDVQSAVVNTTDGASSSLSFILRGASDRVVQFAMQQPSGGSGGGIVGDTLMIDNINMGNGINILCRNSSPIKLRTNGANVRYQIDGDGKQGWFGHATQAQQTITGAKLPSDVVLANLLTALAGFGFIIDSTT